MGIINFEFQISFSQKLEIKAGEFVRLKCNLKPNEDHRIGKGKGNQENLADNTSDDQIQLNSIEFNENQWMSIEINEHQ